MTVAPDVSVVIPTRDRPRELARTLQCVLAQRDVSVEVIIVDDGSVAPAEATLSRMAATCGHALQLIRHDASKGVGHARNAGIDAATAPWIGFCDDDDLWAPTKAVEQLRAAGSTAGWTCSATVKVDTDLYPLGQRRAPEPATVADRLLAANVIPGGASSVIARADIVRAVGGFDTTLSTLADWDFWVRLAAACELAVVDRPLLAYVVHDASMSMNTQLLDDDLQRFLAKHAERRSERRVPYNEANWQRYVAELHLRGGRRFRASAGYAIAVLHGRPKAGRLALASLVAPRWANARLRSRRRKDLNPDWADEVETWLAPLRDCRLAPAVATGGPGDGNH